MRSCIDGVCCPSQDETAESQPFWLLAYANCDCDVLADAMASRRWDASVDVLGNDACSTALDTDCWKYDASATPSAVSGANVKRVSSELAARSSGRSKTLT